MIMLRTLHKDISSYNELQTLEEAQEESGWNLCGDVFRPPTTSPLLLSVMAGTGVQITVMMVATMICALFGLTSPANRGGLLTTLIFLFVMMGSIAGSARVYKLMHGKLWKRSTFLTATLCPRRRGIIRLGNQCCCRLRGIYSDNPFSYSLGCDCIVARCQYPFSTGWQLLWLSQRDYRGSRQDQSDQSSYP